MERFVDTTAKLLADKLYGPAEFLLNSGRSMYILSGNQCCRTPSSNCTNDCLEQDGSLNSGYPLPNLWDTLRRIKTRDYSLYAAASYGHVHKRPCKSPLPHPNELPEDRAHLSLSLTVNLHQRMVIFGMVERARW